MAHLARWLSRQDLNLQPGRYERSALTIELQDRNSVSVLLGQLTLILPFLVAVQSRLSLPVAFSLSTAEGSTLGRVYRWLRL